MKRSQQFYLIKKDWIKTEKPRVEEKQLKHNYEQIKR
jgi:hypothetical protein